MGGCVFEDPCPAGIVSRHGGMRFWNSLSRLNFAVKCSQMQPDAVKQRLRHTMRLMYCSGIT